MSREKECKCCHEWWCASDIKEDLCPNCYDCFKQLKQQLAEKDNEIKKLNWQLKDKDFIIKNLNHSLSVAPNANAGQRARIDELTKIVKEKDKEIAYLKEIRILKDNSNMSTKINGVDFSDEQILTLQVLDILKRYNQKALAIQELEKVKIELKNKICMVKNEEHCYSQRFISWYEMCNQINNQIKELKGEK